MAPNLHRVIPLVGAVKHYAWGSATALPAALGQPPDGRPWAEVWWGTHPGGRTLAVTRDADPVPLVELAGSLPYLVKLLAAERPLSLQAHPSEDQAATGFADEQQRGVPIDAPERTYPDPFGKPEMLVAITEFDALCGFRPTDEAAEELVASGGRVVAERLRADGPLATTAWLLRDRPPIHLTHPLFDRLATAYPGDPGAVVALLLNRLRLTPGEAIHLPSGVLHMYLHGVGLEVMGSSDNVVRGGLTLKHVDVTELLRILDPAVRPPVVRRPGADGWYGGATDAFAVEVLGAPQQWRADGPEIVVRLSGRGETAAWFVPIGAVAGWSGGLGCRVTSGRSPSRNSPSPESRIPRTA